MLVDRYIAAHPEFADVQHIESDADGHIHDHMHDMHAAQEAD